MNKNPIHWAKNVVDRCFKAQLMVNGTEWEGCCTTWALTVANSHMHQLQNSIPYRVQTVLLPRRTLTRQAMQFSVARNRKLLVNDCSLSADLGRTAFLLIGQSILYFWKDAFVGSRGKRVNSERILLQTSHASTVCSPRLTKCWNWSVGLGSNAAKWPGEWFILLWHQASLSSITWF